MLPTDMWGIRLKRGGENTKRPLVVLALVGATAVLCTSIPAASPTQQSEERITTIRFVKNPEPLPEFTLKTVDEKTIASSDLRGKIVLLNFWATWCPPCLDEIPELIKLQSKYAGHLQIIGLSLDFGPPESVNPLLKQFIQQRGINYPAAVASSELQAKFGGILGLPTAFLLDEHSQIVQKHVGVVNPGLYETEIRALLNLPVAAKVEFFEDTGKMFSSSAKGVRELPGVDLSKLAPERKETALRMLNGRMCSCACRMTLAQCRIADPICTTSLKQAADLVAKLSTETGYQQSPPTH